MDSETKEEPVSEILFAVQGWDYYLDKVEGKGLHLYRTGTPRDGGYNGSQDIYLPETYFNDHSVEDFHRYVAGLGACVWDEDAEEVTEEKEWLEMALKRRGWIGAAGQCDAEVKEG